MKLAATPEGFRLLDEGRPVWTHEPEQPCCYIGQGEARFEMYRGNFDISDYLTERIPLRHATLAQTGEIILRTAPGTPPRLTLHVRITGRRADISFTAHDSSNRIWLRLPTEAGEPVWGCGEQMSYFNLRGRRFPLWTSEPGVGRDKSTAITFQADVAGRAGGDYYHTNYPQPTFLAAGGTATHVETTAYSVFDFRHESFHELEIWAIPERLELYAADTLIELVETLSTRFGRQPPLPDWIYNGAILGLKQGERSFARLDAIIAAGARVSALWCEDWSGIRETSFGRRLFWDWRWQPERYPNLPRRIAELHNRGIRFLGYVNPYLCNDGTMFPHAEAAGYLARRADGSTYLVDFGEFDCGVIDLTQPEACAWFGEQVLGENMMGIGLSGWMADFGEYLPVDVHLANGVPGTLMHNAWPTLWAKTNAEAVARAGRTGDVLFFMRAGYTGVQAYCPLLWAGDQCVDFSRHDGLQTVICAALSSGLLGNAFHHSDIGGYTSLFGLVRTAELLQRWAEMAAFTPVMRSHESNRPDDNLQIDQDPAVLAHFARMTRIYVHLAPYLRSLVAEAGARGLPVQRPLFLHFEHDRRAYGPQDSYLYGPDLLVAPVHQPGVTAWTTYLPAGETWVHLWSGAAHEGGVDVTVAAPLGQPPVFFRAGSTFRELFEAVRGS